MIYLAALAALAALADIGYFVWKARTRKKTPDDMYPMW